MSNLDEDNMFMIFTATPALALADANGSDDAGVTLQNFLRIVPEEDASMEEDSTQDQLASAVQRPSNNPRFDHPNGSLDLRIFNLAASGELFFFEDRTAFTGSTTVTFDENFFFLSN